MWHCKTPPFRIGSNEQDGLDLRATGTKGQSVGAAFSRELFVVPAKAGTQKQFKVFHRRDAEVAEFLIPFLQSGDGDWRKNQPVWKVALFTVQPSPVHRSPFTIYLFPLISSCFL